MNPDRHDHADTVFKIFQEAAELEGIVACAFSIELAAATRSSAEKLKDCWRMASKRKLYRIARDC